MSIDIIVQESPFCKTVTFINDNGELRLDIFTQRPMDDEQLWMYVLGEVDIPSYDVYKAYKERDCLSLYNKKVQQSQKIVEFFGINTIREKMDELAW
jgi:hypothetical protein